MSGIDRKSQSPKPFPTHEQIETRAYEIYLQNGCEQGHALDHWCTAEQQLLHEQDVAEGHLKSTTIVVAPDGTAEMTPERDIAVEEEEMAQVRASEKLKEERQHSASPSARAASAGHRTR